MKPPDQTSARAPWLSPTVIGLLCGATAALFWAISLVSALHGISIGITPLEIAMHRIVLGRARIPAICQAGRRGGHRRRRLGPQHRADADRRGSARAVQQCRLSAGAARAWRRDPAFDRGAGRAHSRDHRVQGARVSLAHDRRRSRWSPGFAPSATKRSRPSAYTAFLAIWRSPRPVCHLRCLACCSNCGALRRSGLWRSPACCRWCSFRSNISCPAFRPMIAAGFRENLILALVQGVLSGCACDLSVHPRGGPARRREGGCVSRRWCRRSR